MNSRNRPTINSLQNPTIKNLVKLRQRRHRDRQKMMLIDGVRALRLALKNGFAVETLFVSEGRLNPEIAHLTERKRVPIQPVSEAAFQKIGYGDNPDGYLGLAPHPAFVLENFPVPDNPVYLIADGLEKPGNLGAILRSADAAGISGLIICNPRTDIYNPNIIRASQGAFFAVSIWVCEFLELADWLHENKIQIFAATPDGQTPYTAVDLCRPTALVVGSEDNGLRDAWLRETCIHVPMAGQVDSLNVAQTATLLMFEAVRQRAIK